MSLSNYKLNTSIAVSDMARAREFYEGKLGLTVVHVDGGEVYASGGDTPIAHLRSPGRTRRIIHVPRPFGRATA
jgi:catechol 2,3-dioxygenase-like lactoylglutathione lyase family enzyme